MCRGPFLGSTLEKVKAPVITLLEGLQLALYKLLQSFHEKVFPNRDWRRLLLVDDRFRAFMAWHQMWKSALLGVGGVLHPLFQETMVVRQFMLFLPWSSGY
jgi:hypothetical protein